jgi:hypothetical protein
VVGDRRVSFSGQPPPVQPETGPVPGNDGFGLHDDEDVCPARPDAPKGDPEGTIDRPDAGPAPLDHGGELLPKGDVLEQEIPARTESRAERRNQRREEAKHGAGRSRLRDNSSRILG